MAGAFDPPLFFSTAMITTSSRLQHLDSHFSLHTRLSSCRQTTSRPHIDRIYSAPPQLVSSPLKIVKRSTSRSSRCSDAASFHTAISNTEEEVRPEDKTAYLPHKETALVMLESRRSEEALTSKGKAEMNDGSGLTPCLQGIPVQEPLKASPERSHSKNQKESSYRIFDRQRRVSTTSEPLPRSSIPRRTSSTAHRRQRKGQDLISFHRDSCRLFQSLGGTLSANYEDSRPVLSRHSSMPGSSSQFFSRPSDTPMASQPIRALEDHLKDEASVEGGREFPDLVTSTVSLPVTVEVEKIASPVRTRGATVMSWTTAETRQREHEKIDQAHSGLRGLWKKVTPKWCHGRNSRRKFFEGKCDGDSVRRYRVDVPPTCES